MKRLAHSSPPPAPTPARGLFLAMDPNATLTDIRRLVDRLLKTPTADIAGPDLIVLDEEVIRLARLLLELDGWLMNGGALPDDWARPEKLTAI